MQTTEEVKYICEVLQKAKFDSWLVGGAVRDNILGREAHDWDIATNAKPQQVISLFNKVIETGIEHGTVSVILNNTPYEITTYRGDGKYSDGRRPDEILFLDKIEDDLARRDFTVNAIAYDPIRNIFCDPFGGIDDIKKGLLRAVGIPLERFFEDGLRVLRAARFAATLGFSIEQNTFDAIRPSLATYTKVAIERVQAEWIKAMMAEKPSIAFQIMADTGMLALTIPEFLPMIGCTQNRYHSYDVWKHTLEVVDFCPIDPIIRIAALFHDIGKPSSKTINPETNDANFYDHEYIGAKMTDDALNFLKFSNDDRKLIVHLVENHYIRYTSDWTDSPIRRWVRKVGIDNVDKLISLSRADILGKGPAIGPNDLALLDEFVNRINNLKNQETIPTSTKSLAINGNDLKEIGIMPGPKMGIILNNLLELITDNPELNSKEKLLELALSANNKI